MQHFVAITCEAMARSVYTVAADAPNTVSVQLLKQGLHNTPALLRKHLQAAIDAIPQGECDAILLVYGMCGLSTVGLTARHTPLILPRAHDCITLYLGSKERYQEQFETHPGTYWYSLDYMERSPDSSVGLGAATIGAMDEVYEEYVEKYGRENADYLMAVMGEWGKHYDRAVFLDMGNESKAAVQYEKMAQDQAQNRGWQYERIQGNHRLVKAMLDGEWSNEDFLVVPPGYTIQQSAGSDLVRAVAGQDGAEIL